MFQGSIVAIITPWKDGKLDKDAFANLIDFQIENGTAAIVPCGTTGESATMAHEEHHEVVQFTIEHVKKRVPVIAGAGSNSTAEAISLTEKARDMGADATLHISPYYNKPTQDGIYEHYKAIADKADSPIVVYNCPGRTGSRIEAETIFRLSELPRIVALKDAVGDIDYTSEITANCDLTVLSGNDSMNLPIMAVGGKGAISVLANVAPRATADLCNACLAGDFVKAQEIHKQYYDLCKTLFIESNPIPVKTGCSMLGLCSAEIRMPMTPITEKGKAALQASMQKVGLLK